MMYAEPHRHASEFGLTMLIWAISKIDSSLASVGPWLSEDNEQTFKTGWKSQV